MNEVEKRKHSHFHYAGRCPAGANQTVVLKKDGVKHLRRLPNGDGQEILSVGLACSECFSGPRLGKLLQPGLEYEQKVMENLLSGEFASPLSIHTSGGVPEALSDFIEALAPHLPWDKAKDLDWCVSLQLEGASAVWAAIDMVLQSENNDRKLVAVANTSYHGPPSTSFGSKCPLWEKTHQVIYPVPVAGEQVNETLYIDKFQSFLDEQGDQVGVLLIEPQWGSSQAAFPWPDNLLKTYVAMAKAKGIRIICDEIMCGLGRHGRGSLFASRDLELDPDAITFGKAIGGGVYPISGAVLKKGRDTLCNTGRTVMQSHTYAGSSVRALMTATEVLKEIPKWIPSIVKLGEEMAHIFRYLAAISDGMLITHGQGLMWGAMFSRKGELRDEKDRSQANSILRRNCEKVGVMPYIVPCGGFMVTPVVDIDVGMVYEIGQKLEQVVLHTMKDIGWVSPHRNDRRDLRADVKLCNEVPSAETCRDYHHLTKSYTSCSEYVSPG
eukprot:jgi/Psemu1/259548/estExt_Genewise1Plus.C_3600023